MNERRVVWRERWAFSVVGCLGVLEACARTGLVSDLRQAYTDLLRHGIRFDPRLLQDGLARFWGTESYSDMQPDAVKVRLRGLVASLGELFSPAFLDVRCQVFVEPGADAGAEPSPRSPGVGDLKVEIQQRFDAPSNPPSARLACSSAGR